MTRDQTQQFFDRRVDAWRRHDVDALMRAHTDDCVLESPLAGKVTGRPAIENVYRAFVTSFPDLTIETSRAHRRRRTRRPDRHLRGHEHRRLHGHGADGQALQLCRRPHLHVAGRPDRARKTHLRLHRVPPGNRCAQGEAYLTMSDTITTNSPRLQVDDPLGRRVVVIDKPVFRIGRKSESDLRVDRHRRVARARRDRAARRRAVRVEGSRIAMRHVRQRRTDHRAFAAASRQDSPRPQRQRRADLSRRRGPATRTSATRRSSSTSGR